MARNTQAVPKFVQQSQALQLPHIPSKVSDVLHAEWLQLRVSLWRHSIDTAARLAHGQFSLADSCKMFIDPPFNPTGATLRCNLSRLDRGTGACVGSGRFNPWA